VEKWREDAQNGRMHEPIDVTIELDGLGRQLSELPPGPRPAQESGPARGSQAEGADKPVFVDASGRRGRKFRRAGWIIAIACACYALTLVAALIGGSSSAPWLNLPGIPGLAEDKKKDAVQVGPGPSNGASSGVAPGGVSAVPTATDADGNPIPQPSGSTTAGKTDAPRPGTSNSPPPAKPPTGGGAGGAAGGTPVDPGNPPPDDQGTPPGTTAGSDGGSGGEAPPVDPGTPPPTDPGPPTDPVTEPAAGPSALGGGSGPASEGV
jgi:hypothetical protein